MCRHETVTVNLKAVNWLKEKYPELCIKAGLCERIGGRLYTKTHYTTPQQRTWVGLDPEEIRKANHHMVDGAYHYSFKQGAEWAEAKLKEKNT
jgi:hypothetical protein